MPRRNPAARGRAALSLAILAALLAAGAALLLLDRGAGGPAGIPVRTVVRDVLTRPDTWEVVRAPVDAPPRAGVLCPSPDPARDGADVPALVLAPPAEVRLRVLPGEGPVRLATAAGLSFRIAERLGPGDPPVRVTFEVDLGAERVFEETLELSAADAERGTEWVPVGGPEGLALAPGDVLTLRTRLDGPAPPFPVAAGFRRMLFERVEHLPRQASSPERPNVVLVVQDTLRADRLSAYGYGRPTSPRAEELAARGVLFEEALSTSSWTWPSTASLLTGLLPPEHGVTDDSSPFLDLGLETLAEALQREGFTTAAWSGNPLVTPGKNFGQGFESFEAARSGFTKSTELLPPALDWIRAHAGTRFFAYLHLVDPHEPHLPSARARELFLRGEAPPGYGPKSFNRYARELLHGEGCTITGEPAPERVVDPAHAAWMSDLYDACVHTADEALGQVLDTLAEAGLDDETIVVFTSDHGEELLEHGLLAHGQSLHRELVRVPLIAAGPGIPRGVRVATPVSNRHLAPTLARLGGGALADVTDAQDLLDLDALAPAPLVLSTTHGFWNGWYRTPVHAYRAGDWVLHWAPDAGPWGAPDPSPRGELRLYDLALDPAERRDRAPERPLLAERLRREARRALDALAARRRAEGLAAGEATLHLLQNIGYLDE